MSTTIPLPLTLALALILGVGSTSTAAALDDPLAAMDLAGESAFKLLKVDGTLVSGPLKGFGPAGEVILRVAKDKDETFPSSSFVKLYRDDTLPRLAPDPSASVLFPEGDRIRSAIGAASETHLEVQSYSLGKLSIPLESILGLVLSLPTDSAQADSLIGKILGDPRTSEVVWLANGDRLSGGFLALSEKQIDFLVDRKPLKLDRSGVSAVGFDPSLVAYPKPEGDFLEFTFLDGSRVGLKGPVLNQDHLTGTTRFGVALRVGINEVVRIHRRSASLVYLDDRSVAAEKYVTYIGDPRPFRKNVTIEGHLFRLSGREFDRGLGTESRTLLAYRLEPGDSRFQALVGLDDRAGPLGNVVFKVIVDNKERFKSPPMSVRDQPKPVDIDLTGAKILVLITEFGERGNVRDIADWVEARILR